MQGPWRTGWNDVGSSEDAGSTRYNQEDVLGREHNIKTWEENAAKYQVFRPAESLRAAGWSCLRREEQEATDRVSGRGERRANLWPQRRPGGTRALTLGDAMASGLSGLGVGWRSKMARGVAVAGGFWGVGGREQSHFLWQRIC